MYVTCDNCGEMVDKRAIDVARYAHSYCDLECKWEFECGENGSNWQGGPVTVTCAHCGKEVEQPKNQAEAYEEHYCDQRCRGLHQAGPNSHRWNGGRKISKRGYVLRKVYGHPNSCNGYVLEHRLVKEFVLDRFLEPGEVVHHINGFTHDNRPSNLQLFANQAAHLKHHKELEAIWLEITGGERILETVLTKEGIC